MSEQEAQSVGAVRRSTDPSWLGELRGVEQERFLALGMPTRSWEAWRYTNLKALAREGVDRPELQLESVANRRAVADLRLASSAASLVFVDGVFCADLSRGLKGDGVEVQTLRWALEHRSAEVRTHLGSVLSLPQAPLVALNTARFEDGAWIHIAARAQVSAPIELLFVHQGGERPITTTPRVLVLAGPESRCTVVERYVTLGEGMHTSYGVSEIRLERGARVAHVKVQQEGECARHLATTLATTAQGAEFESHVVSIGAQQMRNAVHVSLAGERSSCRLNGVYAAQGQQSLDHYTEIDHVVPHCTSEELYKGLVSDTAVGSFLGRILMQKGAVGSATAQLSRTLLLSETAQANAKPQLEIDNDDVRAAHGATVGQLDESALFYLRSRGIPEPMARGLLVRAFVSEVVDAIPVEALRASLTKALLAQAGSVPAPEEEAL